MADSGGNIGVTGGLDLASIGGSIFGALGSASASKMGYQASQQIANLEMQADAQRRQAMEISARRQQLQTVRSAQQASSMNLASAVNSGAQFSSAAEAGRSQPTAQAAYANLGVSQNLQIGENLFGITSQINEQKMIEAEAQSNLASSQGISSLFGSLGKAAGPLGNLATLIPNG